MKLAFFIFFLLVLNPSFSQVLIKPKIGTAVSCMQTDLPDYSANQQVSKARIQAGVAVELPFKKRFVLQPELLYTVKGLRDTFETFSRPWPSASDFKGYLYNFHYLELPVMIRFLDHNLRVGAGPSVAYLFHTKYKSGENMPFNIKRKYSKLDVGLNIEAAYRIKLLEIGTRFTYGLSDVKQLKNSNPEVYSDEVIIGKNRSLQFYLSYCFNKWF